MRTSLKIGNDVVDLAEVHNKNKYRDRRFVSRVFTSNEQSIISKASDPDLTLWSMWAAKETTYKIIKKINPDFILSYARIEVDVTPLEAQSRDGPHAMADGQVLIDGSTYAIRWMWTEQYVNCVGINESRTTNMDGIRISVTRSDDQVFGSLSATFLTQRELSQCFSEESIRTRLLAKHLLKEHGVTDAEIIRRQTENGFGEPSVISDDSSTKNMDLSLSHDGEWISIALLA